jgi:hypothetical protein
VISQTFHNFYVDMDDILREDSPVPSNLNDMDDFLREDPSNPSNLNDMDDFLREDPPNPSNLNDMDDFLGEDSPKASCLNDMDDFLKVSYLDDMDDYLAKTPDDSDSEESTQNQVISPPPSPFSEQAPSDGSQYVDDLSLHRRSSAIPEENLALNAILEWQPPSTYIVMETASE